jgi:large subunit ribosomal protein L18
MKRRDRAQFRRRKEGKTNYNKRLRLLSNKKLRLVVRITNKRIISQIIEYEEKGDKVLVSTDSQELKKYGWKYSVKNTPAAYLTGILCASKAGKKGVKNVILDIGLKTPSKGARIFAVLKGAIDGGLKAPYGDEKFPDDKRVEGESISKYRGIRTISKDFIIVKRKLSDKK